VQIPQIPVILTSSFIEIVFLSMPVLQRIQDKQFDITILLFPELDLPSIQYGGTCCKIKCDVQHQLIVHRDVHLNPILTAPLAKVPFYEVILCGFTGEVIIQSIQSLSSD